MIQNFKEVKIEVYVPEEYIIKLRDELNKVNACRVGDYDHVVSITNVRGYWRPLEGSNPFNGKVGNICEGTECKMEIRCRSEYVKSAIAVIREIHPYDEPLINIIPLVNDLFE